MNDPEKISEKLFFDSTDLNKSAVRDILNQSLAKCDDGELYLEYTINEALSRDEGRIKTAAYDISQGYGLRGVCDTTTSYAHSSDFSLGSLKKAAQTVEKVAEGYQAQIALPPSPTNHRLYNPDPFIDVVPYAEKVKLLETIESYVRSKDPHVKHVSCTLAGSWKVVRIMRADGFECSDIRPLVRLDVAVTLEKNGIVETAHDGSGGRYSYDTIFKPETWQKHADEAIRQANVMIEALPAPAGEMDIVLGNGWTGVMLHEAIGHGLEGDFHRRKTSVFTGMEGKLIANPDVTIVDDGTLSNKRGSISYDDEGTGSACNTLIKDGRLVGLMHDRLSARKMGVAPTGNGRRQSYAHKPMPRMTNTLMLNGSHSPEDVMASVKNGLYAVSFGGGQVDITSGQFVFEMSEAYKIENGKITAPVKGATMIGKGADALTKIRMVANNSDIDPGIGSCGKDGQSVPVGVGQPSLSMSGITVGGTEF